MVACRYEISLRVFNFNSSRDSKELLKVMYEKVQVEK